VVLGASNGSLRVHHFEFQSSPLPEDLIQGVGEEQLLPSMLPELLECPEVPVAAGGEPPFAVYSGAVAVQALALDSSPHIFAAAWLDGRVCLCSVIPALSPDAPTGSHWKVLKSLQTSYSFFDVQLTSFPACIPRANCSTEDVNADCAVSTTMLVAAAHSGHVIMMPVLPRELLKDQEIASGTTTRTPKANVDTSRSVLCFNSSHRLRRAPLNVKMSDSRVSRSWQGGAALSACRAGHLFGTQGCESAQRELELSQEGDAGGDQQRGSTEFGDSSSTALPEICFAFLNTVGDVDIVRDVSGMVQAIGSSTLDDGEDAATFSAAEVRAAGRVVHGWHCRSAGVGSSSLDESASKDSGADSVEESVGYWGLELIDKLSRASLDDLHLMDATLRRAVDR